MKKIYFLTTIFNLLLFSAFAVKSESLTSPESNSVADTSKQASSKITDNRPDKPKGTVSINMVPFKPVTASRQSSSATQPPKAVSDVRIVSNVKVYPNPVADQLNLSYYVNKDSNVTIKIMDVLGNEIATLLSQRMPAGEQTNSFQIASRLNSGYYFIRLIVGNETVVKRISIM